MAASSSQHGENADFFSIFSLGGIHRQGIFPVIPLEFQGKKHQPFSRTQPKTFVLAIARMDARAVSKRKKRVFSAKRRQYTD